MARGVVVALVAAAVVGCAVAQTEINLMPEIPTPGSVGRGEVRYYELMVSEANANVSIEVSPLYGDPDLFVSCTGPASPSHFTWAANHFGRDYIDIYEMDRNSCVRSGGRFHIGVYGWTNTTYILNAAIHTASGEAEYLMDGIPVEDHVDVREVKYYQFYVRDQDDSVEFVLTPQSGDPDLLVGCYPHLTVENAQWKSWSTTVDRITVNATTPGRCVNAFYVGVLGYTDSNFTLFARSASGRATVLTDRMSMRDAVYNHEYQYFEFNAEADTPSVNITVVPRVGDPDLYVDCTTPSKDGHWKWRSIHTAGHMDTVVVSSTSSGACHVGPEPRPYQIAVYGFTYAVFDIVATNEDGKVIASRRMTVGETRYPHMRL